MNLDSYKDKWKSPNYPLYELSQEVLRCCNVNNMEQIIKSVTRTQYNSVTNKTAVSCIDHIYTNVAFKCSSPEVISFGDSDHDLVGVTRLSKRPPEVSRTIRKRSYRYFDKDQFLSDVADINWVDVLSCPDLDYAVELFTEKFRSVLDIHAPWIVFQQRKNHKPWISPQTLELMKK